MGMHMGMNYSNPTVEDGMMSGDMMSYGAANVFLVWSSVDEGIEKATDTFLWEKTAMGVQVKKQNIVATEMQACPTTPEANPSAPTPVAGHPVTLGWDNHFTTFGDQNRTGILLDYTESSVVQIWSWGGADEAAYSKYTGLDEIGGMFDALWASMNAQTVEGSIGLAVPQGFPRVEVDINSVFLTWSSYSNPKATDTFLFDDAGKILRQTIVTTTGVAPAPYMAPDVATAWTNHFEAFGGQDLDRTMLDYHEGSVLQIFNDGCDANGGGV